MLLVSLKPSLEPLHVLILLTGNLSYLDLGVMGLYGLNIGDNWLKGYLEEHVPWIVCFWCLVHRLELALKDALKDTLFLP